MSEQEVRLERGHSLKVFNTLQWLRVNDVTPAPNCFRPKVAKVIVEDAKGIVYFNCGACVLSHVNIRSIG